MDKIVIQPKLLLMRCTCWVVAVAVHRALAPSSPQQDRQRLQPRPGYPPQQPGQQSNSGSMPPPPPAYDDFDDDIPF